MDYLPALIQGLFNSLQFIVLNKDLDDVSGWRFGALSFFQFALPLFASSALLGGLFRDQLHPIWIRSAIKELSGHYVIVGYGDFGVALNDELTKADNDVVAIDIKEFDHQELENEKVLLLKRDVSSLSDEWFKDSGLIEASCLYLLLPDENENLRILKRLQKYFATQAPAKPLKIYLRTETHALRQMFTDWVGLDAMHGQVNLDIRPVNPYDIVARGVVNEYSPDSYVSTDKTGPIAQTIMIVGTSQMAQSLLLRFARMGIYSPLGKLRVIWVGDEIDAAAESLIADYPFLDAQRFPQSFWGADATTDSGFYQLNLSSIDLVLLPGRAETLFRAGAIEQHGKGQLPAVIYVCHDDDIRNLKEARDLQSVHGPEKESSGLILALQNRKLLNLRKELLQMRYKIKEESIDQHFAATLVNDKADDLAEQFKNAYDSTTQKPPTKWSEVSYFEKESNRDAADHGAIKAIYAGMDSKLVKKVIAEGRAGMAEAEECMEKVKDALYLMEQRRYRAFMGHR